MPIFRYRAKNQHGETVNGKVEARNEAQAAALLQSRGLFVIGVNSTSESSFSFVTDFFQGIKQDEVVNITRQLSTMVTAGLPLLDGLRILEQQSKPAIAKLIAELIRDIEGGGTFADALAKHPKVFDRVFIQLVRAGEAGGVLDEILNRLADNLERSKEFRAKTKGALIYPTIVMIAMGLVGSVMMIFVIPKLTEMYKDFDADLPFATQLLIGISNFFVNFWWLMLAGIFGGISGIKSWGKTKKGRIFLDSLKLKMPIMGVLRAKVLLTEFSRTMSLLLSAGISLLRALEIVTEALDNVVYRDALKTASEQVEKGVSLGDAISAHNTIFPPILFQMISVGEETGKLDEVLLKLANYFQSESEQAIKNLTTALEPLIMVVLGLMVGVMVIAIIMPIYNLTSQF